LRAFSFEVTLTRSVPAIVRGNRTSLNRAFRNLIINAATHGKRARVAVESTASEAPIVIDDDGRGIPFEMIGQVFEPFFRASRGRTKDIEGAGLGLTIAHEIVQRAGGRITIENGPVRGLLQTEMLPVDRAGRSEAGVEEASFLVPRAIGTRGPNCRQVDICRNAGPSLLLRRPSGERRCGLDGGLPHAESPRWSCVIFRK
jgi:signal transduction histidine kinase